MSNGSSHWVFGYGSLIWRPGFDFISAHRARLHGARRTLCVYSHHYRGTPEVPGLVFGLVRGGSCHGMAFEVADENWAEVHAYLRDREQITGVYREAHRAVRLSSGTKVEALVYLVDEAHEQYAGDLSLAEQAQFVRRAAGDMGPNLDYVVNTARHLTEMGIRDPQLHTLADMLAMPVAPDRDRLASI